MLSWPKSRDAVLRSPNLNLAPVVKAFKFLHLVLPLRAVAALVLALVMGFMVVKMAWLTVARRLQTSRPGRGLKVLSVNLPCHLAARAMRI